jgi:N-methylhydantoinase A
VLDDVTLSLMKGQIVGQVHECTVEIDTFDIEKLGLGAIAQAFHTRHKKLYNYDEPKSPVEVVNVESTIIGHLDKSRRQKIAAGKGAETALQGYRDMVFSLEGTAQSTPVYTGSALGAGNHLSGPAVIEEVTTTIVIEPGWNAALHESGVYVLTPQA